MHAVSMRLLATIFAVTTATPLFSPLPLRSGRTQLRKTGSLTVTSPSHISSQQFHLATCFCSPVQHLIQSNPNNISSLHILIHYSLAHRFPPRIMPTLNISIPCHQHKVPQAQGRLRYSHPLSSLPPPLLPSTFSPLAT